MKRRYRRNVKIRNPTSFVSRPLAAGVVTVTVLALGFLWLHLRCAEFGRQIKTLEQAKKKLVEQRQNEEAKWCEMTTPQRVQMSLGEFRIQMDYPDDRRIVRLPLAAALDSRERVLVARNGLAPLNE